jgi:DNA-directed RNA polymerase specialized sigma24 family protein
VLMEPLGTVKTDIYRARNILQEKLREALNL